jgi:hypothetical protein
MALAKWLMPAVAAVTLAYVVPPAQATPVGLAGAVTSGTHDGAALQRIHYGYGYYRYYGDYPRYYRYRYYRDRHYRRRSPL